MLNGPKMGKHQVVALGLRISGKQYGINHSHFQMEVGEKEL